MAVTLQNYPLKQLSLFAGVDADDLQRWLSHCELKNFAQNDVILQPNIQNDMMYIILSGQVSIHLGHAASPAIASVGVGECVGEMSLFDSQNPSAYVMAQTDIETLAIDRQILLSMVDESHDVSKNLLYLLSRRLRSGNQVVNSSQRLQKEYEQHANVDALTGLYNRRWMDNYFKRVCASDRKSQGDSGLSLMMVDADHFKQFNDQHGHNAGDFALKCIADALQLHVRPTDIAIRYGGEEFIILLPDTDLNKAQMIAERVREGVAKTAIKSRDETYAPITVSIGLARMQPEDEQSDLVIAADEALYLAKTLGRNKVCINDRENISPAQVSL
ncbi:MAG: GGDEF domain-containing protein [Pseudomonadales bacterium]|nr:GGDEF domain-containing protein [Pseudomonadales bacterium]